ncbi:MAG: hypothetical protein C0461_02435 [Brevundimonas sp.]|nr:hypothetical protein [Brevundimonas sp.]
MRRLVLASSLLLAVSACATVDSTDPRTCHQLEGEMSGLLFDFEGAQLRAAHDQLMSVARAKRCAWADT